MTRQRDASALIAHIRASQAQECERLVTEAREAAHRLLREARQAAGRRVREAVAAERERIAREQALAAARVHTAERECAQQRLQALFGQALSRLESALLARWDEPGPAARWIESLVAQAAGVLPTRAWTLVHGDACWAAHHEQAWARAIGSCGATTEKIETVPALRAGLRIRAQGVVLDATLDALLGDRRLREALLDALDTTNPSDPT